MSPNRSYHHGNLRAALLDEAARMIASDGVASVTMRAIGERLGVSRAAPYRHFPDKTALLAAVAAAGFERLHQELQRIDASESRGERFRSMGGAYIHFALGNPAHYRLMYGEHALARAQAPELRAAADELFAHLVGVIEAEQNAGRIREGDPQTQAYIAWSAMHGLASLLIDRQIDPATDVEDLIDQATHTVLRGMQTAAP